MLVDKQSELMRDLLFTVHQHGGDDVTWKPPIARDNSVIPRCKIDRRHSHFRANILHQKKSHKSRKKKVNWCEQCYVSVVARSVANLLCPDKWSLVCGSGEELAEDPLTLSIMKSPAYAPDLLLENCDQMVLCTANHTQTGFSIQH